ncbi:FxsA family protein [Ferrimonas senticii]|uniref:FxsA family protein n=1 Tax=Ferrimonas senticii TaxID=394566 RepID=UPI000411C929|nr:FxsA family protein [Ferrimonas senticii]
MFPLFLLFAVMPIVEIYLLMTVGSVLGALNTVAIVLLTAALGASLVRSQGLSTLMNVQRRLNQGELPGIEIMEGVLLAVAGVLLVTPGFVTDFIGLLLLTPFTRRWFAKAMLARVQVKAANGSAGFGATFGQGGFSQGGFGQSPFEQDPFAGQGGRTFDHEGDSHVAAGRDRQLGKDDDIIDADYRRKD